jgi:cell division protein ZapA
MSKQDPNTFAVNLLGKEFLVACPPKSQPELEQTARYLDQKMQEIKSSGKVFGLERIAVMTALNITNKYLHQGSVEGDVDEQLTSLHNKLDAALGDEKQMEL